MLNEDSKIKNVLGKTGSGKSLICTEEWTVPALIDGEEVWTCLWINWKGENWHFFKPRDFNAIKDVRNAVVIFDEYRQSFDPRRYQDETEEVRAFFELHRHRHNDIRGNTQSANLVALTIAQQAHEWSQVERLEPTWWNIITDHLIGKEYIRIKQDFLTFAELKKMSNGWELGEDVAIDAEWVIKKYEVTALIHRELNDKKQELIHAYCPKCKMRQGFFESLAGKDILTTQIKAEDTDRYAKLEIRGKSWNYSWKEPRYCCRTNHADVLLEIKESGMFDTDYEPIVKEEEYKIIKMQTCKTCGKDHLIK